MYWDTRLFLAAHTLAGRSEYGDAVIICVARYVPYLTAAGYALFVSVFSSSVDLYALVGATLVPAVIARFVFVPVIRLFYNRPRPYESLDIRPLIRVREPSFPSGHAVFFCALGAALFPYSFMWGIGMYGAALAAALFRVVAGAHYPSDVFFGATLGTATAWLVYTVVSLL